MTTGAPGQPGSTTSGPTIALMKEINAAFNSRDVDRIMSFFTDDCTFYMARGPEPCGRRVHGKTELRRILADRFKVIPDMRWEHVDHFITVTLGRGIGLGIIAGGDIYRGFRGGAGEFGHTTVADDGPKCTCGKRGCLEALVSDPALVAKARAAGILTRRQSVDRLRALADAEDAGASGIYAEAGATLGRSVGNLVNVLGPELVLISGEGTQAWTHLEPSFTAAFRSSLFPPLGDVLVEVDPWDDAKWAVGAATLVLRATFTAPLDADPRGARGHGPVPAEVVA